MKQKTTGVHGKRGQISRMSSSLVLKKKKKITKTQLLRAIFIISFISIPIIHFIIFTLYVNADTVLLSFERFDLQTRKYRWVHFENYIEFFEGFNKPGSVFAKAIRNSILFFLLNDFVILPLSFIFAFFMYKKIPFANGYRIIFYLPSIISPVVLTMLFSFMFDSSIGIVDSLLRVLGLGAKIPELGWFGDSKTAMPILLVYCVWSGIGANIVLISGAMSRIPQEIIEAGKLDGLSMFKEMIYITLPLTGSLLATLWMMGVPVIFTFFLTPMLITNGGPDGETYTIAMYIVTSIRNDNNITMGATVGVICAIVGTPIVVILRKVIDRLFPAYEY